MTIYEISEMAGVSIATVSRVLNGSDKVSDKTRNKIQAIINANKYTPQRPGKKKRPERAVGILCGSIRNPRTASLVESLMTSLHKLNYKTHLICCGNDINEKRIALAGLCEMNMSAVYIDGRDFLSYDSGENSYIYAAAQRLPVILLNSYMEHNNIYSVLCDEADCIFSVTEERIKHNRRGIIFLLSSMSAYCAPLLEAFSHAFYVHGTQTGPDQIHLCPKGYREAYDYISGLINNSVDFDCIIASDDILALGALNAVKDNKISFPDDMEIIGNGCTFISETASLTSIDCQESQIVLAAVNTLIGITDKAPVPSRITFPAQLIKRGTSR